MPRRDDTASRALVRRLSHDVLQRSPNARELETFVGAPVGGVIRHLQRSREAMAAWVEEELFYFLLLDNFRPPEELVERLPELLRRGKLTVPQAMVEIMLSTGFSLRNPGNDTFVTVVIEQCLGLEVQDRRVKPILEAGKKMYDGRRARFFDREGQSQADVVKIVAAQRQFARHVLDRHHRRVLGVPLPAAREADADRLHEDGARFFEILGEWLASPEYADALRTPRLRNDRQFARSLYSDLLGRLPTYEELRNMRNALQSMADSTPLRAVLAKVLLDSGQARLPELGDGDPGRERFVRECFLRYLGRAPSQLELDRFAGALGKPATRPEHVVRALVTSLDYQYY